MDLKILSDDDIIKLIKCPKQTRNLSKCTPDFRHKKKNYNLTSEKFPNYQFMLYYRQNNDEKDDYSVGLLVTFPCGKQLTLIRFNGSSHCHPNRIEKEEIEWETHIHSATHRYIQTGHPNGYAIKTDKYQCADEALEYACEYCNIQGIIEDSHYPKLI